MNICLVGINHQTAPISVREKVTITAEKLYDSLLTLRSYIPQGIILSTCNRTEIYTIDYDGCHIKTGLGFLKSRLTTESELKPVYFLENRAAVEHLFRIACGLESMIVGEFEVLGQVAHALGVAEKAGVVNLPLRHLFQSAIHVGRRVREETGISKNPVSTSSVAVDLATKVVGDLKQRKILVIGAGEAGRLVVKVARERGVSQVVVASRSREKAQALAAELGGTAISTTDLLEELRTTDIVVTCAGAPHWVLTIDQMRRAMEIRPDVPLVIIDIAVPRNVEPAVSQIENVFLYNIDNLAELSNLNRKQREGEIQKAGEIIASELDKFASWWQDFKVRPLIRAMMSKAEEIRRSHLDRTMKRLPRLSEEERYSLEMMTKAIVSKILKAPIHGLKASGDVNHDYAEMVKELFQLDTEDYR